MALNNPVSAMFPARLELLGSVVAFLERCAAGLGLSREALLRLNVVAEELFVNTVRHGHGGGSDAPVWIGLQRRDDDVVLAFEDLAPAFNPYPAHPRGKPSTTLPVEEQPVGGLGLVLTRELSHAQHYAYLFGRNCVRLHMSC